MSKEEDLIEKEYYLCGPPAMIAALQDLLKKYQVPEAQIRFDEF